MQDQSRDLLIGTWYGIAAYTLWGVLPIYWKLVDHVPSSEVLAHRIFWSLIFMAIILLLANRWQSFIVELKTIFINKKLLLGVALASILISINWFTYIFAVTQEQIVEASLGYYINPLVSVLLGIIVLKERLSMWQIISFSLAAIGVVIMTIYVGSLPWLALILAVSFGFYGLVKKMANLGAITGLTIETLLVAPIALIYISIIQVSGNGSFMTVDLSTTSLLIMAGVATALPLLFFASSARRVPLSMIGFLQYIAPTISLIIGVFLYKEPFSGAHLLAFTFIWIALTIFTLSRTKWMKEIESRLKLKGNQKLSQPNSQ